MKKSLMLLIALIFLTPTIIQAQDLIQVSGYVTNEQNGDPVPNREVNIMLNDSLGYSSVALTNQDGFYFDSISTWGIMVSSLYIYTDDLCTSFIHDTLVQDPGSLVTADFEICVDSIPNPDCQADFGYILDSVPELVVFFYDQSIPANAITSWSWNFGDGNTSSEQNPVHEYSLPGTYNVCLTIEVADSGAICTDTYCMDILVISGGGGDCQADFYYSIDSNYISPLVYFYDNSTPAGLIDSWFWDFGDGTTSTQQNPVHTYPGSGVYGVCLTITADSLGCTSTYCDTIMINVGSQYQLGGNVFSGIYQLDYGFAYAYKSEGSVITNVYAEMIDTLGYYLFYPLVAADYYLKAEPSPNSTYYGSYMPTYYGDVVTWENAVLINLSQTVHTADINLVPMSQATAGPGQITGSIFHEGTQKDGIPVEGIQIMLINELGEYVRLEYSDEDGQFSFSSMPYGTYTLYAEVVGLIMNPEDFTISEGNEVIDDISMVMTDEEIYFDPSSIEMLEDISVSEIYPNPVTNILRLELGSNNQTSITVRILNQYGQLLRVQKVDLNQGQIIELNTNDLSSGMYFLELITKNNFRTVRRFVKL